MENIGQLLIKGLGWSMIHSLWQGALLYAAVLLVFYAFPRLNAKWRALLPFMAMLLLLGCLFATLLSYVAQGAPSAQPMLMGDELLSLYPVPGDGSIDLGMRIERYFPLMATCYVLGVLLQLFLVVKGYQRLGFIRRNGLYAVPRAWQCLFEQKLQQMGIRAKVSFKLSAHLSVPAMMGYTKPVVLFPLALVSHLSLEQVEAILIHELAHIKRNDYLVNIVKTALETTLFFNPFMWLLGSVLDAEREHACDDEVLRRTLKPMHYARTLLQLQELQAQPAPIYALHALSKKNHLLNRIKRITSMKKNLLNAKQKLAILTILLGCIVSLAWVRPMQQDIAKDEQDAFAAIDTLLSLKLNIPFDDTLKGNFFSEKPIDTLPFKGKSAITFVDKDGSKLTFQSFEALPDSLKAKFEAIYKRSDSISAYYSSPEWKEKMAAIKFSSEDAKRMSDSMKRYFDSPEWKKNMEKMERASKHLVDSLQAHYNSPEWKAEMKKLQLESRHLADSLSAHFNSPEWKEKIQGFTDSITRYFNSSEWKSQMKQWEREAKGIDTVNLSKMTLYGKRHHINQSLTHVNVMKEYESKYQKELASLQKQYASLDQQKAPEFARMKKLYQDQYRAGVRELQRFFAEQEKKYSDEVTRYL